MKNLRIDQIETAMEEYLGYCTECQEWTRECTEPDVCDYDCPICGQNTVIGAAEVLFL